MNVMGVTDADGARGQEREGRTGSSGAIKGLHRQERLRRVHQQRLRQQAGLQAAVTRSSDSVHWSAASRARTASNGV